MLSTKGDNSHGDGVMVTGCLQNLKVWARSNNQRINDL